MTYDPAMDGSAAGPRRADEAPAPAWPVLARLPWVGEEKSLEPALAYEQPLASLQEDYSPPPLRIAEELRESNARRHYRIDPGVSRKAAPPTPAMRVVAPREEAESFAGHIYQWHAALAPYAGVAVTFVLALFAGLLYWSTFGRQADPTTDMTAAPQWEANANVAASSAAPTWAGQPSFDLPESPLSQTPDIRLNIPPLGDGTRTAQSANENIHANVEPEVAAPSADVQRSEDPAATPIEEREPAVATAPSTETAAALPPSPAAGPLKLAYPTTPFASFDFGPPATQNPSAGQAATPDTTR